MHHPMTHLVEILVVVGFPFRQWCQRVTMTEGFDGLGDRFSKVSNSGCGDVGVARFEEILNSGHVDVARY